MESFNNGSCDFNFDSKKKKINVTKFVKRVALLKNIYIYIFFFNNFFQNS